jgi:phosphopantetheine adenylyltransferase
MSELLSIVSSGDAVSLSAGINRYKVEIKKQPLSVMQIQKVTEELNAFISGHENHDLNKKEITEWLSANCQNS